MLEIPVRKSEQRHCYCKYEGSDTNYKLKKYFNFSYLYYLHFDIYKLKYYVQCRLF